MATEHFTFQSVLSETKSPEVFKWQRGLRQWFHQHPETAFQETLTSEKLQQELKALDIPFTTHWGKGPLPDGTISEGTGIIATIGTGKSPCVALRADIDALPVTEKVESSFRSLHEGRMHACGHDGHMASLMSAARYLKAHEHELQGTVRLMFQPAEEQGGGAKYMVEEGVLEQDPPAQAVFGLHVNPQMSTSEIWSKAGVLAATSTSWKAKIYGKGGHGSMPHLTKDPTTVAAAITVAIDSFVARSTSTIDYDYAGVMLVTMLSASQAPNVIPSTAEIGGTIRAFTDERMHFYRERLAMIVKNTAEMYGCRGEVEFLPGSYPCTRNDPALFEWCQKELQDQPGFPKGGLQVTVPLPGSEDFSYFALKVPGVYFLLGVSSSDPMKAPTCHSEKFQLDEEALPYGSALLAYLAIQQLKTLKGQQQ